ncbi:pyridoxamine 5'-phosphate oxidase family protein [Peptococcus simiae]|uniref:Pyridoxamine 5'-phosphate oxidase family protein n=1 Tax=Peptococcus simiae TaxID=1643805 RepID=A0ABW9GXG4_9FIRM
MAKYHRIKYTEARVFERLPTASYGILSLIDAQGRPYGVPLNYVYVAGRQALYFHAAKSGRKIDAIRAHNRAHFTVVLNESVMPEFFVTNYDALMLEGTVRVVEDEDERLMAITALCDQLAAGEARRDEVIAGSLPRTAIVRFDIEAVSGKANRDR